MASESSTATSDAASMSTTMVNARPYCCRFCPQAFRRAEHLKRHVLLHTGERQHQCSCGMAFSRSDVLANHVKGCVLGVLSPESRPIVDVSKRRRRVKRACDRCAILKVKCDYGSPCGRCRSRVSSCEYRRETNSDLRLIYKIGDKAPADDQRVSLEQASSSELPESRSSQNLELEYIGSPVVEDAKNSSAMSYVFDSFLDDLDAGVFDSDPPMLWKDWMTTSVDYEHNISLPREILNHNYRTETSDRQEFDIETDCIPWGLPMFQNMEILSNNPQATSASVATSDPVNRSSSIHHPHPLSSLFSLDQIDPLEAKCREMHALLRKTGPQVPGKINLNIITRENLLSALQFYGQHFQRNLPILHAPTFNVSSTSALLLLAMFCVGACYGTNIVSSNCVFKMAMHVLLNIESQQETDSQEHSLSTIQASMLACTVLACSENEFGFKVVSVYLARTILMAKKAKIFDAQTPVNYNNLSKSEFEWHRWVQNEIRNRIACALFCQDTASCIFQGSAPTILPFNLDIELPCYAICWEAKTSEECFGHLKSTPSQLRVSAAIKELREKKKHKMVHFEASAFGMFVLIKGLHCLIWHSIHYDLDASVNLSANSGCPSSYGRFSELENCLRRDLSGASISALVSEVITDQNFKKLHDINQVLENWHWIWKAREFTDGEYENRAFALDPVPFFWLGQLFLLLHCGSLDLANDSEFVTRRLKESDIQGKMGFQGKIFKWLSKLKIRGGPKSVGTGEACLAGLMEPISEN